MTAPPKATSHGLGAGGGGGGAFASFRSAPKAAEAESATAATVMRTLFITSPCRCSPAQPSLAFWEGPRFVTPDKVPLDRRINDDGATWGKVKPVAFAVFLSESGPNRLNRQKLL